jgi:DNA mismatch repair protein MutS
MADGLTPMMAQYQKVRRELPEGTLLLFRLGDFFELFFEDAKEAAAILDVALTKRNGVPMCGVPARAAEAYLSKLIKAGKRVAVCDQVGEAVPGRIVERELTQIVSPGTITDLAMLDARRGNYLAAVFEKGVRIGLAWVDLSTGEFRASELQGEVEFEDELARVAPSELLVSDEQTARFGKLDGAVIADGYSFLPEQARFALTEHFGVQSLDGFGCEGWEAGIGAAGAVLHYVKHQLRRPAEHLSRLICQTESEFVVLDAATQMNLELVVSRGAKDTSLLGAIDRTVTPMGARLLRGWILRPLRQVAPLVERQEVIAALVERQDLLSRCREALKGVRDIERIVSRLHQSGGNARDLVALRASIERMPSVRRAVEALGGIGPNDLVQEVGGRRCSLAELLAGRVGEFPGLSERLGAALVDEPPVAVREGGMFREGFDAALDELRSACFEGKEWIARLQQQEIESTGIKSLKVRYNSVFGYFIEVTKSNLPQVPDRYIRKQTTVNGERFITPELKEMEGKILGADERGRAIEYELFVALRGEVLAHLAALQETAAAVAEIDVLCGLAEGARLFGYARPRLSDGMGVRIRDGRHPVLDQALAGEKFVPNDVALDGESNRVMIVTGPNMAGKSTYIRQVALIVLMAQIGAFVPAAEAEIGLVDRIFTRVGASDDLARGRSTFMVEMTETANILNNATPRSLVVLDEIGRGTSTFDGLSIAWSVAEFLHDEIGARTLFATHYHELTELALTREGVTNWNVAVREWNDQVIFLRKIIPGCADKSYGIQVARLAGLPAPVVERAKEILANLERSELNADGRPKLAETVRGATAGKRRRKAGEAGEDRSQMALL